MPGMFVTAGPQGLSHGDHGIVITRLPGKVMTMAFVFMPQTLFAGS